MQGGSKSLHGFLHGIEWVMFHDHSDYFQQPARGGRPNTQTGRPWHSERLQPWVHFTHEPRVVTMKL